MTKLLMMGKSLIPTLELTEDDDLDSDDYDPAFFPVVQEFDLAIKKLYSSWDDANTNGVVDPGEKVTFNITVYNQGTLDAIDVVVTDYVPTRMIFNAADNPLWTGGTATEPGTTVSSLAKGGQMTLSIVLQVDPSYMGSLLTNNAEITKCDECLRT
ncbi:MAG: hypothetical protein R2766_02650 [Saprospiraceae bacterium]